MSYDRYCDLSVPLFLAPTRLILTIRRKRGFTFTSNEFRLHLVGFAVLLMSKNEFISSGKSKSCPKEAKFSVKSLKFNHAIT